MTEANNAQLWPKINAFSLDDPDASFKFSDRLARENGWTHNYTYRVIEEYKRFVFLAMTAGHPVTPSVAVDQAWHLHLTYTQSYWEQFCGEILKRPLHHGPTKGGQKESNKFNDWYARTLASYEQAFGQPPPTDIWPEPHIRFDRKARIRQVSDQTHWIIRKPQYSFKKLGAASLLVALICIAVLTLFHFGSTPQSVIAQDDYIVSYYEASFAPTQNNDGDLKDVKVTLLIEYTILSGSKSEGFKFVGKHPVKNISVTDGTGNPLSFRQENMDETKIVWQFPPVSEGTQTVIVQFTLEDALIGTFDKNEFKADWIKNWRIPVYDATYRFTLPAGYQTANWSASPNGTLTTTNDRQVIEIHQNELSDTPLRVSFEPGIVENGVSFSSKLGKLSDGLQTFIFIAFIFGFFFLLGKIFPSRKKGGGSDAGCSSCGGCSGCGGCGGCGG